MTETMEMYDAYPDAEYRVLELKSDLETGSYVKVHKYNSETKETLNAVYSAFIMPGETILTALPEGEYVSDMQQEKSGTAQYICSLILVSICQ